MLSDPVSPFRFWMWLRTPAVLIPSLAAISGAVCRSSSSRSTLTLAKVNRSQSYPSPESSIRCSRFERRSSSADGYAPTVAGNLHAGLSPCQPLSCCPSDGRCETSATLSGLSMEKVVARQAAEIDCSLALERRHDHRFIDRINVEPESDDRCRCVGSPATTRSR